MTHYQTIVCISCCILTHSVLSAVVVSYYRFEEDIDGDLTNDQVVSPSEIAGQPDFISNSARIDVSGGDSLPDTFVPNNGLDNLGSLDGRAPGGGNPDINGTIAYTPDLNIDSMTVEMWVRSEEQVGVLVSRSTTGNVASAISDGFRIYDPDDLTIQYYTEDAFGNTTLNTISTSVGLDNVGVDTGSFYGGSRGDGITEWRHLAFVYDEVTGTGSLYLDSIEIGTSDTTDGSTLYWGDTDGGAQPIVQVGVDLDGFNFSKDGIDDGYVDELRFSSDPLMEDDFLPNVPEPSSFALIAGCFGFALCLRRRR